MADDRTRSTQNLAPKTRQASEGLRQIRRQAEALAAVPNPVGIGAGKDLIDREVGFLRHRIGQLTAGTEELDLQLRSPYRLLVVGPSNAGKSTLINVIAGHRVLPTTGAGDAKTLKETILTYSSEGERTLRVRYIGKQEANQRRFMLESYARKLPDMKGAFREDWTTKERGNASDLDDEADLVGDDPSEEANAARRDMQRRYDTLILQIKTLIYPEVRDPPKKAALPEADLASLQEATLADWVDGWRILLGQEAVAGGRFGALWRPRLAEAADLLGKSVEFRESSVGPEPFRKLVERHTAEGLAFLVDRVELALNAPDLEQMDVEDLPGVGNYQDPASDIARDVLTRAMRERDLDGLLVVTAKSGLDQNTANLVEEAAVLRRVLEGQTDLAIAVTHIDQIARQWVQQMEDAGRSEDDFPPNDEVLRSASEQVSEPQRARLTNLLRNQIAGVDEPDRTSRVEAVLERTHVVGVEASAAEAYKFKLTRKMDGAFAKTIDGTCVPELIAHFKDRAQARHDERMKRVVEQTARIQQSISADLARIVRDHDVEDAQQFAAAARETYLAALEASKGPLSNQWATTRERTATKLEYSLPAGLLRTQLKAQKEGSERKRKVIRDCRRAGPWGGLIWWSTMEAALRWGGTWTGAHHLDLPGELAGALMPALLSGWRQLADEVEVLLAEYRMGAEALLGLLEAAARQAAQTAGVEPNDVAISEARTQLGNNLDAAMTLLNAQAALQTERVPQRLRETLKGHFEAECQRVLRANPRGQGPGYTDRLLRGYDHIGDAAIEKGAEDGVDVLRKSLATLNKKIQSALFDEDPVTFAYRRLIAGIHDAAEAPEVVAARTALVSWAKANLAWATGSTAA